MIVSNGVGVDSMAMLIELARLNVRPDAVVTAMVGRNEWGNENRLFYAYFPLMERWLQRADFPAATRVWYELKRKAKHRHYESLAGNCLSNRMLPSISYRRNKSCSLKWKGQAIDQWVTEQYGDQPCYRAIGFDCFEGHRTAARFAAKKEETGPRSRDVFFYPLQYLGVSRHECVQIIQQAGMPVPAKSSCIFCASMHPEELDLLFPDELWRIVILEANAQPKLHSVQGFWTRHRMTDYIISRGLLPARLVHETWAKWSADTWPEEMRLPDAVADRVLFEESYRLAGQCGFVMLPPIPGVN